MQWCYLYKFCHKAHSKLWDTVRKGLMPFGDIRVLRSLLLVKQTCESNRGALIECQWCIRVLPQPKLRTSECISEFRICSIGAITPRSIKVGDVEPGAGPECGWRGSCTKESIDNSDAGMQPACDQPRVYSCLEFMNAETSRGSRRCVIMSG